MKHFKSNGFSLVEALVALAIMAVVLMPLFMAQSTIFTTVRNRSVGIDRLFFAKKFMADARRAVPGDAQTFEQEKKITKPNTTLKYTFKPVSNESSFKKIEHMYQETVTMEWQDGKHTRTDTVVNLLFRPPTKSKKAA